MKRACRVCKRVVTKNICPYCKSETTSAFQGTIMIFSIDSEIANKLGITEPGRYALRV